LVLTLVSLLFRKNYNNCSDAELLNKISEDRDKVITELYERYAHLVLGLCLKYLKNRDEAQEAVISIYTSLADALLKHRVQHFKSWLYVFSKNHCLMQLRKRQSMLKKELELAENVHLLMDFNDPSHLEEKEKQILYLEEAIETLNDNQKVCIQLFYLSNKSYQEIADTTGLRVNDVKSHIQNGKRNLKISIERKNEQERK
jgi:RNA polymerase sigma factor (sigma-70 family)